MTLEIQDCSHANSFLKSFELYDPAVPHLSVYARERKTYVHIKTCPGLFTATLCIIAKKWEQPERPSADEWINEMWYIYPYSGMLFSNKKE